LIGLGCSDFDFSFVEKPKKMKFIGLNLIFSPNRKLTKEQP